MAFRKSLSYLLVALQLVRLGSAVKPCLHLARLRYDEPECTIPQMTTAYCHNTTSSECATRHQLKISTRQVCDLVTQSLLAEYEVFDVVFLPSGACQADIRKGNFTYQDAKRAIPEADELIYVRMSGYQLLGALEHGHSHLTREALPKHAGIKFNSKPIGKGRVKVFSVETLGRGCVWKPLNPTEQYNILTVESLVNGRYGYQFLPPRETIDTSGRASRMGVFLRDSFWKFANNVCTVRDPFRRPIRSVRPIQHTTQETVIIQKPFQLNGTSIK